MMTGVYNRLGVPVWASNLTLIRALRKKLNPGILKGHGANRKARRKLYREIIRIHTKAGRLYWLAMQGGR